MNYFEQCNKYFAPLDEIDEALRNNEGISTYSNENLKCLVSSNKELRADLIEYTHFNELDLL